MAVARTLAIVAAIRLAAAVATMPLDRGLLGTPIDTSRTSARPDTTPSADRPVTGMLSMRGLPPVPGTLRLSGSRLAFRDADGRSRPTFPLVTARRGGGGAAPAVTLAAMESAGGETVYLFRLSGAVFETRDPGPLLELAGHPAWLDKVADTRWADDDPLVDPADTVAMLAAVAVISGSDYADSLYTIFGRPAASAGLIGAAGQRLGRLGEYIASRDSLSFDPGHMTDADQLRHAFVHELAHRWQAHAQAEIARAWVGVPAIRDRKRYGYGDPYEQQAEAIAFAVHFLQTTAGAETAAAARRPLDAYERLVPGTRAVATLLLTKPIYSAHPLATAGI